MQEIISNLYIGTTGEIKTATNFKTINTAHTYHYELHNWRLRDGTDHTRDKCYVVCLENPDLLSVNWIDGEAKYFDYLNEGVKVFRQAIEYIEANRFTSKVLITCNKGQSRAPSLGMLYLAKYTQSLGEQGKVSYEESREIFNKFYPNYLPGYGITQFLIEHWYAI